MEGYRGRTGSSIRYSDTLERNMVYLALPAFDFDGESVVLRTATPFRTLSSELRDAYVRISIAGSVILVLLTALGYVLIRRVNDALHVIRNAVHEYAAGNLAYRPFVSRPPALRQIAEIISNLAGDLSARVAEASRQRNKLETVFSGMEEAVIVTGGDLIIQEMNNSAYALTDFDPGSAVGQNLLLVFRNSELHELAEDVRETRRSAERDIVLFSERERYLQVRGSAISGTGDEGMRIILVLNDVSRLKDLERVRKDFVANVSHELKTPITALKGYVETLLDGDYKDPETSEKFLKIVLQHVDRLAAIVEDLLIISRLEKDGGSPPDLAICDLNELVRGVTGMYEQRAIDRGIELLAECPSLEKIPANRMLLEQAIANLVDNALKYSNEGGRVKISVVPEKNTVTIQVSDQGSGIPEEHLERVFERFYRIDKGRSRELGGTGLGLSIVKHFATSHGGHVAVESREGEGSTFSIVLPRVQG
jgi:two-component system phosphate regulon sensor histidine kinase PhoR